MQKVPLSSKIETIKVVPTVDELHLGQEYSITCTESSLILISLDMSSTLIVSIFELNGTFCIIFYFL